MTKTVESVTAIPTPKDIAKSEVKHGSDSRASSESPPLVLKYLETLPPEKEVTLLVEVVQGPPAKVDFKAPKIIAAAPVAQVTQVKNVAAVVKAEIKEELDEQEDNEEDYEEEEEDEECFRIIEETVVDASTLPGRTFQNHRFSIVNT